MICALDSPANTNSVLLKVSGKIDFTAAGLKQMGPRIFGFQNCGKSNWDIHDRSTIQTKPFLPATAVSYPCRPSTITSASAEIEGGAALRAMAISAFRSAIRYWSMGAILA